ncbi:MAG TPA: AEC family transporter [Bacteroidetes bacterium]|nr:AEC family transporter [Bacteroidota bacterium]
MAEHIVIYQILILAILIAVGFLAVRTGLISMNIKEGLSQLVFKLTLPLLIFTKISVLRFDKGLLLNSLWYFLLVYLAMLLMLTIAYISVRLFRFKGGETRVFMAHSLFGNIVFLGFPLMDALFPGGKGILYATLYHLVSSTLLWTLGVYLLSRGERLSWRESLRKLWNPNTLAFLTGLFFAFFHIDLPEIFMDTFGKLGSTTIYLSMIYIGILLSVLTPRDFLRYPKVILLSFNKLLLVPVFLMLIVMTLVHFFHIPLTKTAFSVLVLETAMPCMANVVILAKEFGSDDMLAMKNVFVTTLLSIFTLPLVLWVLQTFY